MTQKTKKLLEQDSTLRIIYAFNYFTSLNEEWIEESLNTIHNRELSSKMGYEMDDAYFMFANKFYSLNYQRSSNDIISCEIKEYDNYYDLATHILIMRFEFSISNNEISITSEESKKLTQLDKLHQKRMKAA